MLNVVEKQPGNKDLFRHHSPEMKARLWLDQQIAVAGVTCMVAEVTPAIARVLLDNNPANRSVSEITVSRIARDIENDTFVLNGESIIIAKDGTLNDGQHRLCAILQAGKAIRSVVVFGPERETRVTVDQGKSKMVGDYLAMEGHSDSLALAAMANYAWQWKNLGRLSQAHQDKPRKGEIMAFVEGNEGLAASLEQIDSKGANGVGGRSLLAFCHWAFSTRSRSTEAASNFITALLAGANLLSRDPILYARNRLMAERRMRPNERAELIFRAWNAHRRGDQPKTLPVLNEALPVLEG